MDRVRTNIDAELVVEAALSQGERVRLRCRLAKRLESAGAYEEARELLRPFWPDLGERPAIEGLDEEAAANLLLRAGVLTRWIGGDAQLELAQEAAKDLISESLSLFERLELVESVAEAQTELAECYWREGAVDEARILLNAALARLGDGGEVKALALLRLALVEDLATRYSEGYRILKENAALFESLENHTLRASFHNELATAYYHLGSAENRKDYLDLALVEYAAASFHLEQAGHARYLAHVENNIGLFFHILGRDEEAHEHLDRARELFESLGDRVYAAQVDETRARILLAQGRAAEAERMVRDAAEVFESVGQQALLTEALITRGRAVVEGFIRNAMKRHGHRVEFTPEAIEAMSRMFLEDGLHTLEAIIEETVAKAPRGTIITADDVEVVALRRALPRPNFAEPWSSFSLKEELRQPERRFIELALKAADGKISVAARLLGFNHNEILTSIIKSRYPELLAARKPPIPRRRSIISKPKPTKR